MRKISMGLLISILFLTMLVNAPVISTAQNESSPYINVQWQYINGVEDHTHSYSNSRWMFGPQPSVTAKYLNGTNIMENDFKVDPSMWIAIEVLIPKNYMPSGATPELIKFWGYAPTESMVMVFMLSYNVTSQRWVDASFAYRRNTNDQVQISVIEFSSDMSAYHEGTNDYNCTFVLRFTSQVPASVFWTELKITDSNGMILRPSWLASIKNGRFRTPPIGVGMAVPFTEWLYPVYYDAGFYDTNGDHIFYTDVNQTFVFKISCNEPISYAIFDLGEIIHNTSYYYELSVDIPASLTDKDTTWKHASFEVLPSLFYEYNASIGPRVLVGYPSIYWTWTENKYGGFWQVNLKVIENSTLHVEDYFVVNNTFTFASSDQTVVQWGGYLTSAVDASWELYSYGTVFHVDVNLGRVVTQKLKHALPSYAIKQHGLSLAFGDLAIQARLESETGDLIRSIGINEWMNISLDVYARSELINGSIIFTMSQYPGLLIKYEVKQYNITYTMLGHSQIVNDTHVIVNKVRYSITIDFESGNVTTYGDVTKEIYLRRTGALIFKENYILTNPIIAQKASISMTSDFSRITTRIKFTENATEAIIDRFTLTGKRSEAYYVKPMYLPMDWTKKMSSIGGVIFNEKTIFLPPTFMIGNPRTWEPQHWTVTEDGALDLDGDIHTTADQYFVQRVGTWNDIVHVNKTALLVKLMFDPSPEFQGDEFRSDNWMGLVTFSMDFNATETFYWYHASDMTPVNSTELNRIRQIVWANQTNKSPNPGYEYIAWLTVNKTLEVQIGDQPANHWEWSWFGFGTSQYFLTAINNVSKQWAFFRAEFAGFLLFKDNATEASPGAPDFTVEDGMIKTSEVTHYFTIDKVGKIKFTLPFDSNQTYGNVNVSADTQVNFGVELLNINGTLYPIRMQGTEAITGAWDLRQTSGAVYGLDPANFDYYIETASIDKISFMVHFSVDISQFDPNNPATWNHEVSLKVDQYIGNWNLHHFDNSVLENRSLAITYFGVLGSATRTQYSAGNRPIDDTNMGSISANTYQFGANNTPFAEVQMGGATYVWGKDGKTYSTGSSTAPVGAFSAMYQSSTSESITTWTVNANMLFMSTGFSHWDGKSIDNDPAFVAYVTAQNPASSSSSSGTTGEFNLSARDLISAAVIVGVIFVIIVVVLKRKK